MASRRAPGHEPFGIDSQVSESPGFDEPYAISARHYLELGWWPIPLSDEKKGLPAGFTGYRGRPVEAADVSIWVGATPGANVALRLPSDVVAIDVDAYEDKPGAATLRKLEQELGRLPATWVATARDLPSGKYLFRVPTGVRLRSDLGPGVEVCQFHHRFVVVAPSMHSSGATVRWVDSGSGEDYDRFPQIDDLPDLPFPWLERFSITLAAEAAAAATHERVRAWLKECAGELRPGWLGALVDRLRVHTRTGASRHDSTLKALCQGAREAQAGAYPATDAVDAVRTLWNEVTPGEGRDEEFADMLAWAVGQLDTADGRRQVDQIRGRLVKTGFRPIESDEDRLPLSELPALTDAEVAEHFGEAIRGVYLYCAALGGWMAWDGTRWKPDETEAVYERARQYAQELLAAYQARYPERPQMARGYSSKAKIESIVRLARRLDGIAAQADEFDRHPDLLNCTNAVVDLRTGTLRDHDPDLRVTLTTGVAYLPNASHPDVTAALGAVDPAGVHWLQSLFGYAATGDVSEDLLPVLEGSGSNGKTTVLGMVKKALGEYAIAAPSRLLMSTAASEHPTLFATLRGRRLVTIEETPEGGTLNIEAVKMLTGGSSITARYMRQDYFEFAPTHQLVLATNHRPQVEATDYATWRRLRLVPFPYRYVRHPQGFLDRPLDTGLRTRLSGEQQRQAALAWIVHGAVQWHRNQCLPEVTVIQDATEAWRRSEDLIVPFAQQRLRFAAGAVTSVRAMWEAFQIWCSEEGRDPWTQRRFGTLFERHELVQQAGVKKTRSGSQRGWKGVALAGE
jgi:putative DNA primase/helicase